MLAVRIRVRATTGGDLRRVDGLLVADRLDEKPTFLLEKLLELEKNAMKALAWPDLLRQAAAQWQDYFDLLLERAPEDGRLAALSDKP